MYIFFNIWHMLEGIVCVIFRELQLRSGAGSTGQTCQGQAGRHCWQRHP